MVYVLSEIILFLYQIIKKNNKIVGLIGILILGYLAGSASPIHTFDYPMYWYQYNQTGLTGNFYFEKWYSFLGLIFYKCGMDYAQFRLFFALMATIIMYIGVLRFTNNVALFTFIYGATVFVVDATQIRSYMMIAIIILAISFLKEVSVKNGILFLIFIIIAAQFQSSAYIFLLILPIRIWIEKRYSLSKVISLTVVLFGVFLILGKRILIQILITIASFTHGRVNLIQKISGQYTYGISVTRFFCISISTILALIMANYILKKVNGKDMKALYSGIVFSVLTLPFLYIAADYQRLQRGAFLFFVIMVCKYFKKNIHISDKKILFIFGVILVCVITIFSNVSGSFAETVPYLLKVKF